LNRYTGHIHDLFVYELIVIDDVQSNQRC